ncbi:hypothetical protein EDD76_10960 [Kineothrix alysoides]|uniref:Uncharacterized protein n=1 Tax=Kineothrix alysoides TaxID=1469948 RepID=A0A4R1QTL3_9FIRM|nr:hypothetical protein [Kineothrix alysoides]TCL57198.1 hypothetical protein EDD76_10960 [Kineothrix alysoides]
MGFDVSLICNLKGMDSLLHMLHPYTLITESEQPELSKRLQFYLEEISREYNTKSPFAEAYVYSLMIRFFVTLGSVSLNANIRFPGITNSKQHEYVEKFMMVCNYITDHCTENIRWTTSPIWQGFPSFISPDYLSSFPICRAMII